MEQQSIETYKYKIESMQEKQRLIIKDIAEQTAKRKDIYIPLDSWILYFEQCVEDLQDIKHRINFYKQQIEKQENSKNS